ncbi:hypothetical protein F6455_07955 [Proteobacteria bacterium 005FR1]|nr:hypothetical protein [Proteobacteria bacterium 005FR1]
MTIGSAVSYDVASNVPNFETDPWYLWGRIPLQAVFMAFAYYGTGLDQVFKRRQLRVETA